MTRWTIKTEFFTDKPLEHGNWSAVEFETEAEAMKWWLAKDVLSATVRVLTLTNPKGYIVDTRKLGK